MKITKLVAKNVYGHLAIDVNFNEDVTFLTGLNGSGKTSALRLLMALLTPHIEEFSLIEFEEATVFIEFGPETIAITACKHLGALRLTVSGIEDPFVVSGDDLTQLRMRKGPALHRAIFHKRFANDAVIRRIHNISTPMFLGLDRRLYAPSTAEPLQFASTKIKDDHARHGTASLVDVNDLFRKKMREIQHRQERLSDDLRNNVFERAFQYEPVNIPDAIRYPTRNELDDYRHQLSDIEEIVGDPNVLPGSQAALREFLEKTSATVGMLEDAMAANGLAWDQKSDDEKAILLEWVINRPQVDRVAKNVALLTAFISERDQLRESIDRFVALVNSFFVQTNKMLVVTTDGSWLGVKHRNEEVVRGILALSSGERQMVVMLAHLSLNPNLAQSGVFIVDEPELSLHIAWQERFVDAIREANPNVQIILATHSPAIILDRADECVTLGEVTNA